MLINTKFDMRKFFFAVFSFYFTFCCFSLSAKEVSADRKALTQAFKGKNLWLVNKLMESNSISIDELSEDSQTPLMEAAYEGDLAAVQYLISKGANVNYKSNFRYSYTTTPLDRVTSSFWNKKDSQASEIIQILISAGAIVNETPSSQSTPFMNACSEDAINCVKLFFEAGVDLEARTTEGKTALMYAMKKGKKEVPKFLVQKGVNLEAKDKEGKTALFYAVQVKDPFLVNLLLESGAEINLKDSDGTLLSIHGIASGIPAITQAFLTKNFDVKNVNSKKQTALHFVAQTDDIETAKLLLEQGLEINAKDKEGQTPFIKSIVSGKTRMMKFLASCGADINILDNTRLSLVFLAVKNNHLGPTRFLIEKHAPVDIPGTYGYTPLMYAIAQQNYAMVELLLDAGANRDICTKEAVRVSQYFAGYGGTLIPEGTTPLEMAKLLKKDDIVLLLSSRF